MHLDPGRYSDRTRSPAETLELVRPHFASLGITRVARQTGLDRLGIPCFAAIRPNSRSIAGNQGKGLTDDFAMASAVMEAVEFAVAEAPRGAVVSASVAALEVEGQAFFSPRRSLPFGEDMPADLAIDWLEGRTLADRARVMVPLDLVAHSGAARQLRGICQHTNGLASGNTAAEAIFHGLCELVERDAGTLWSLLSRPEQKRRCISPAAFADPAVDMLAARFAAAGMILRLFDQTTDTGIPTILAVSGPRDGHFARHFDLAGGSGTHPSPARAAIRAITEAAQSRVTAIAGARDDRSPDCYRLPGAEGALDLLAAEARPIRLPAAPAEEGADRLLGWMRRKLSGLGIDDVVVCPLSAPGFPVSVVRVLSEQLEDRGPNLHWRPGPRALGYLLEAAA